MWGVMIGLGVALALSPLCPLAVVVLLSLERGVRKAWAFFLGEFLVLLVIAVATVAVHAGTSRHSASGPASWVTLVAGVALLLIGAWLAVRARRATDVKEPSWMGRLDHMEPWPAFLLGMFLPTYLIAIAAGAHIVGTHPARAAAIAGLLVFLLVGTSTVYVPIVLAELAPARSGPVRARLRDWLVHNWRLVGGVLLLVVGAVLIGKAALALT
jgi:threonine/homoserine/homoserine lactone efflux protein